MMSVLKFLAFLAMGELQWWGILVPFVSRVDSSLDVCRLKSVISPWSYAVLRCLQAFFSLEDFAAKSH